MYFYSLDKDQVHGRNVNKQIKHHYNTGKATNLSTHPKRITGKIYFTNIYNDLIKKCLSSKRKFTFFLNQEIIPIHTISDDLER